MGISIFNRTNKGVFVSKEGEVFLGYARQVLEQAALITGKVYPPVRWKTGILRFDTALFLCGKCICRLDSGVWQ